MQLTDRIEAGFLVIGVEEARIDAASALAFKDRVRARVGEADQVGSAGDVLLDLSRVTFVDSSGLGAIVATMKALAPRRLHLAGLTPTVEKVFRLTRMDSVFPIHADTASGLRHGR